MANVSPPLQSQMFPRRNYSRNIPRADSEMFPRRCRKVHVHPRQRRGNILPRAPRAAPTGKHSQNLFARRCCEVTGKHSAGCFPVAAMSITAATGKHPVSQQRRGNIPMFARRRCVNGETFPREADGETFACFPPTRCRRGNIASRTFVGSTGKHSRAKADV